MTDDVPAPVEPDDDPARRNFDRPTLQTIKLDEHPEYDAADITPLDPLDEEGHGYALTVYIEGLHGLGPGHFVEPDSWSVDDKLRELVLDEALMEEERLRLEPLPTYTAHLGGEPGL